MLVEFSSLVFMTVILVVGPGEGTWPNVRDFTKLLVEWNAAMGRAYGWSNLRLYVRHFIYNGSWVCVYGNVHFRFIPSEFLGYLCPRSFVPGLYYHDDLSRGRRRPVRIRFFFDRPRDWSGWDFYHSAEAVDLWDYRRPLFWPGGDPFWDVVRRNVERLLRELPLEQVARGDFDYSLLRG